MPESVEIPQPDSVDLHAPGEPIYLANDPLGSAASLSLVLQTISQYEAYRHNNFDKKWNTADLLYFGWRPRTTWDGTNIPRSSLGVPLVFDQVETAFPKIYQAFFYDPDWFDVVPDAAGDAQAARDVRDSLLYYLEQDSGSYGMSARTDISLAIQSVLLYGNGALALEWDEARRRPVVSWVDLRDLYVDPACSVPWIDGSRSVIRRKFMSVDELAALRGTDPRLNIPPDEVLYTLSQSVYTTPGDNTRSVQEALRGVSYSPLSFSSSPNPADNRIEVLVYYSQSRIIWVLGRKHVAFSESNPYGFIPMVMAPCYNVLGRLYGMGIADVQESNQRVVEGLLNGRLDEVNLMLHPPRAQRRGVISTPSQQRWRPGAVFNVSDPRDIQLLTPAPVMTNVYQDLQYIESLADRRTGVNSAFLGVPRPSNANRTSSGVQAQISAASSRLQKIVINIESCMLLPMLYKLYRIVQYHTLYTDTLPAVRRGEHGPGPDVRYVSAEVFRRPVRFRIMAADKLAARDKLSQALGFISQMVFNGPFIQRLNETGKTVDFNEFLDLLQDVSGTSRRYNLFREMTPEEVQRMREIQSQPPAPSERLQVAQIEAQTRLRMGEMKSRTEIKKAEIMSGQAQAEGPGAPGQGDQAGPGPQAGGPAGPGQADLREELASLRSELERQKSVSEAALRYVQEIARLISQAQPGQAPPDQGPGPVTE